MCGRCHDYTGLQVFCILYSAIVLSTLEYSTQSETLLLSDDLSTAIEMERFMTCLLLIVTASTSTAHNIY